MSRSVIIFDPAERAARARAIIAASKHAPAASSTTGPALMVQLKTAPEIRVDTLIDKANAALETMGASNPNRWLIVQMGEAICELCRRAEAAETDLRLLKAKHGVLS